MRSNTTPLDVTRASWLKTLPVAALLLANAAQAQTIFLENFDGGASTTGFTVNQTNTTDCRWTYAPVDTNGFDFSVDVGGMWPTGAGFDSSFVFLDSDACGGSAVVVDSYLYSAPFDASATGTYTLSFSQQFRARLLSFTSISVSIDGGTTWTEVQHQTTNDVGYPTPIISTVDISAACAGSTSAQLRFEFSSGWDWWWALDGISVTHSGCAFPTNLAVGTVTTSSATFSWNDIGSPSYEWVVTTGALPDGSNGIATGDGSNLAATGLEGGTPYFVFVRSACSGGGNSAWSSGVPFVTLVTNDECAQALPLVVNSDLQCGSITGGSVVGATASNITSTCFGTADDDVWFSFTATAATHHISLLNLAGSTTDLYFALWSGACGSLVLVPNSCSDPEEADITGLTVGTTYYLQVYTYTSTVGQTSTFNVCIGTAPSTIGMQELSGAPAMVVYPDPVNEQLSLRNPGASAVSVDIVDVLGNVVMRAPLVHAISVDALARGAYTLITMDAHGHSLARTRFVKE